MNSVNARLVLCGIWLALTLTFPGSLLAADPSGVNVLTYHNDNARSGVNLQETMLTPARLASFLFGGFGKLFSHPVNGEVFAQPLYMSNVNIPGKGSHNVVFVVTDHDDVYAFDADTITGDNVNPLWHRSLLGPPNTPLTVFPKNGSAGIEGITSTPVIDAASGTLYVVAATQELGADIDGRPFVYFHRLHVLDIGTGAEKFGGPVHIQATFPGTGEGGSNGVVRFDSFLHRQRPGLLLLNGVVYIGFGAYDEDMGHPYHGWLLGYDAQTLQQVAVFNTTPDATSLAMSMLAGGGIWMSGAGLAADSSNIYLTTGNGKFDANTRGRDYGNSVLKLSRTPSGLMVSSYFTPFDQFDLWIDDIDLGSGGVLVLPDEVGNTTHPHLLVGAGKDGNIYLLDRNNLGEFQPGSNSQIVQTVQNAIGVLYYSQLTMRRYVANEMGMPAYFNHTLYFGGHCDVLKAFQISEGSISITPVAQSNHKLAYSGAIPSISASLTNGIPTNGIVWVIENANPANPQPCPPPSPPPAQYQDDPSPHDAVLYAYDATTLSELYSSNRRRADRIGLYEKFSVPTIANGKVYVGATNALVVFGVCLECVQPPRGCLDCCGNNLTNCLSNCGSGPEGARCRGLCENADRRCVSNCDVGVACVPEEAVRP